MANRKTPAVDIHSHLYPNFYLDLLKGREQTPYVRSSPTNSEQLLLFNRPGAGKPMTPMLYDVNDKIEFMNNHDIDISILSLGNPWLDWVAADCAAEAARTANDGFETLCARVPGRLYFFAVLPLTGGTSVVSSEISRVKTLSHCKGVVMGTTGLGSGLDDPELLPVLQALADADMPAFIHPNYGLPAEVYGPRAKEYGQVLQVSCGFTMETTIAVTRLFLSGAFTSIPTLQTILSHAGGVLPFLAGRIESCCEHDRALETAGKLGEGRQTVWDVLKNNLWLDGVVFNSIALQAAIDAAGVERIVFGTDHPLFGIPMVGGKEWKSMVSNRDAAKTVLGEGNDLSNVMGGNAVGLLKLELN